MHETQSPPGRIGQAMPLRMAVRGLALSQLLGADVNVRHLPDDAVHGSPATVLVIHTRS